MSRKIKIVGDLVGRNPYAESCSPTRILTPSGIKEFPKCKQLAKILLEMRITRHFDTEETETDTIEIKQKDFSAIRELAKEVLGNDITFRN